MDLRASSASGPSTVNLVSSGPGVGTSTSADTAVPVIVPSSTVDTTVQDGSKKGKKKKRTSNVWVHWDLFDVPIPNDPENKKKRMAKCKYCGDIKDAKTDNGTTHFRRHNDRCALLKVDLNQSTLSSGQSGQMTTFKYSQSRARDNMIKMTVMNELAFSFVEDKFVEYTINDSFCPTYARFSCGTLRNRLQVFYKEEKEDLKQILNDCPGRVS